MKTLLGTLAVVALLALSSFTMGADARDPVLGTWKLDTARSTSNTPAPKSETRTYTESGDGGITLVWVRVSADGNTTEVRTTFKYDGKEYPVTGSPDIDTFSAKRIDAYTVESKQKLKGKDAGIARRTVSADGKTLTLNQRRRTASGEEVSTVMVYDRQ